jgi:dTMP kinase
MEYRRGRLIVVEGGDSSGKSTQAKLLAKALEKKGRVSLFEFPRYRQSEFAELASRTIKGEFGDMKKLSPYLTSLPYMLDRARAKNLLVDSLTDGHVICDRYTPSNILYQSARLPEAERERFISFIEQAEYGELGLPIPNLVIYLNVPVKVATKVYKTDAKPTFLYPKGDKYKDKKNVAFQEEVTELYRDFAKKRINWFIVECMKDGKLLTPGAIHKNILEIVTKYLNIA